MVTIHSKLEVCPHTHTQTQPLHPLQGWPEQSRSQLALQKCELLLLLLYVKLCVCVCLSQPVMHIPLWELLLHAFELLLHVERG